MLIIPSIAFCCQAGSGSVLERLSRERRTSQFQSKYEGRHNGGVPCFTEERSMERAAKVFRQETNTVESRQETNTVDTASVSLVVQILQLYFLNSS